MLINQTPVNTSKNYSINNISIDDNLIIKEINTFDNINYSNLKLDEYKKDISLTYGLDFKITNQVNMESNFNKYLKIEDNSKLTFNFDKNNKNLVSNLNINVLENENVSLIIKLENLEDQEYYSNMIIKTNLEKNSYAKIIFLNLLNKNSVNLLSIENKLENNSKLDYEVIMLGSNKNIINYYSNLLGRESENNLYSIYISDDKDLTDLNYIIELNGAKTLANMEVEGALVDEANKNFKGTLNFKKGCIDSKAFESENTLLLSEKARSKSLPMMLSSEEKVSGSHKTSTIKIDNNKLVYLTSRGISERDAKKMIVRSNFNKCIDLIDDVKEKENIEKIIDERI